MNQKKRVMLMLILFVVISGCQGQALDEVNKPDTNYAKLAIEITEKEARIKLDELMELVGGDYHFDPIHRTLQFSVNEDQFYLVDGVPVLERNGEYLATEDIYLIVHGKQGQEELFLPVDFIELALGTSVAYEDEQISFLLMEPTQRVGGPSESFNMEQWDVEQMVQYLSFLEKPIRGAEVSKIPSHLPGAPRTYRNGYHEGIDWYAFASGGDISTDTPIYAMGEGVVVRVDHDYVEYQSVEERSKDLAYTAEFGETPEYIFDRLRGRQVWVQYQGGVMNRFAHLHDIPSDIQVGDRVDANTIIGFVGNSGTSDGVVQDYEAGLHLHQDLLIYGELFWKYLSQEEVLEVLTRIWD
ncbi:M23 family metallopeptidase [Halalkalibacter alkalisediminis]|uniref:M23 family metallopeptidase n=1 Tax=Halalkalibacter alkalisediminis TaxID=935616 RepID=A0ABV6NDC1_9BACI|nr:M23 family metallopeptidase [Halalkalibacter alkalisediminis]